MHPVKGKKHSASQTGIPLHASNKPPLLPVLLAVFW